MNGQNCMNMASAEAQALVKRYGEETVEAMSSAVANKGPVVIRDAQGQAVESLLYRDLKKAMGDNLKAWERYMDIMLKPPQGELDKNGEPVYKKSMLAEPTKPKAPGPEKLERKELSQQDIVNETLNSKLKALEKSISKTVQRYQDVDSFKYKKLLRQYADDVSKANVIKFLLYTNGYTYYMSNYLTDALAETSKYRETFAENAQRFRRFLDLTEEINSLDSLAIMDRDMSDFIKDNDLAGMLEGIVKERARLIDTVKFDNGRIIVALDVRGKNRPYRTDNGKFYIRNGSGKREIRRDQLSAFLDETRPLYYENIPVFDFETGSFDDGVLWGFLDAFDQKAGERAAYDTERVLKKDLLLGIGAGEKFLPTVAGVLLFGENESVAAALPHAGIRMSRFSGKENEATLVEQTEISGNLLHLFDAAGKFVERYCDLFKHRQKVKEAEGEDFGKRPSFHMYAINEAICNLIMHRDLALREIESEIRIYDDAIVFLNARRTNGFVPPASRAIRFGITQRINPQIAAIFKRREYGARVPNGGLPMVLKQSELFSGKKPELSTVGDVFRVKVYSR